MTHSKEWHWNTITHIYVYKTKGGVIIKQRPSDLRHILTFSPFAIFNF